MAWDGQEQRKNNLDRLQAIELQLARLTSHITSEYGNLAKGLNEISIIIKKHEEVIYGNGDVGLRTRVDRIEQSKASSDRSIRAVWVAVIGVFVKTIWDLLFKR